MAVCIALMPLSVFAAGLGKLNVSSGLGEPLRADIELISATPEELFSLTAAIANDEAYAAQGIERPAMHNSIQIQLAKNASGNPILKLKTNQAVNDPFLDMLIQVDWASGRLLREYTVLLDPPGYKTQIDKSNISQQIQAPASTQTGETTTEAAMPLMKSAAGDNIVTLSGNKIIAEGKQKKTGKSRKVKSIKQEESDVPDISKSHDDYTTKRGDTLSTVAKQMQVEGVSLDQMLVGLYQNNPNAFSGDNMNRLKAGQIIRTPSAEEFNTINQKTAHAEVKLQAQNWNAYRNKLAGMVAATSEKSEDINKEASGGKVTSATDKALQTNNGVKDVIKLSAGDVKDKTKQNVGTMAEQARIAKLEDAIAKDKALKEEEEQAAELAKIQANKDLLALKSKQMADLQKSAQENQKPVTTVLTPNVEQAPASKVEPKQDVALATEPSTSNAKAVPVENAKTPAAEKPKTIPTPVVTKPVETPPNFIDNLLGNVDTAMLGLGGGALVLLAGGWLFLRNKRKRSLANFEQGILTSGGLKANTVFGNTSGGKVDTGDTSFLTDFSQSSNGNMIDTNDVDPIAEAEVYMAYGREAQAEEILKDAILKEPKRYELHLKLLEMYAVRNDTAAYETIAGELYTILGADDPIWAKVAEMGTSIEPENPLYQTIGDSDLIAEKTLFGHNKNINSSDLLEGNALSDVSTEDIDFSMPEEKSALIEESTGFDFDLGSLESNNVSEQSAFSMKSAVDSNAIQFNETQDSNLDVEGKFDETLPSISSTSLLTEVIYTEDQISDISFDLPTLQTEQDKAINSKNNFDASAVEEIDFNFEIPDDSSTSDLDILASKVKAIDLTNISFDLDDLTKTLEQDKVDKLSAAGESAASNSALINLDLPELPTFSLGELPIEEANEDVGEADTKLELVNAYLEMDDKEGAKELLEEVIKDGSVTQIAKAKELLAKLA